MKKMIIGFIMLTGLVACSGGGGGSSINDEIPDAIIDGGLTPLKIEMLDLNNKPLEYIDVSKIGSHMLYKLKFTNINIVDVELKYLLKGPSDYYEDVMAQKLGESLEIYRARHPGAALREYVRTSNSDDCLVQMNSAQFTPLVPGQSCSYYTYAGNDGQNKTANDTFTEPVSYFIYSSSIINGRTASLNVVQCTETEPYPNYKYDCSNMSKPGFSEQFIKYKILPINGITNFAPHNVDRWTLSQDGKLLWTCSKTENFTKTICDQYTMDYNSQNNTLTQSVTPIQSLQVAFSSGSIDAIYPSLDGSNVWVSRYDMKSGFSLVNTAKPDILLWECGYPPCVPNIDTTPSVGTNGVVGLDGSFWWNTNVTADIYDPIAQTFIKTNITAVAGVTPDGVIIGFSNGKPGCFDAGDSYTSYKYRGPLLNYVYPSIGTHVSKDDKNVYFYMEVPGIIGIATEYGYYKVHTENGLCELRPDDYTSVVSDTSSYSLGMSILNNYRTFFVTPASNMYTGL